jgi:hypothetical protein
MLKVKDFNFIPLLLVNWQDISCIYLVTILNIPDAQYLLIQRQVFCIPKTIQNSFEICQPNYGTVIATTKTTSKMEETKYKGFAASVQSGIPYYFKMD